MLNDFTELDVENMLIPLKLDISDLNMICAYVVTTDNKLITKPLLDKTKGFFKKIDKKLYQYDEQLLGRINFIEYALEARIDNKVENREIILNHCKNEMHSEMDMYSNIEDVIDVKYKDMTSSTIKYISETIINKSKNGSIYALKNIFQQLFENMETGDYKNDNEVGDSFENLIKASVSVIKKNKYVENDDALDLTDESFIPGVERIVDKLQQPSNKLKSGIQLLNEICGGGFEKTRVYLFLGLTGGFKSGVLLSIAKWLKWYNMGYECKDPEKRPTVLFVTQENTLDETVERMFSMTVGKDIRTHTKEEVIQLLRTEGKFCLTEENNIDIVFRYFGNEAIDTGHLYTIADELEEEGRELICLIHDYIGRIRSVDRSKKETREKLGAVANELKNFAIEKDIPVITASQMNREGARIIDAAAETNKEDLARLLGRSNIGESWSMLQNLDFACIINREYSNLFKQTFLTFKRIKIRYHAESEVTYFNHPFNVDNTMQLLDDVDLDKSLSKFSLSSDLDDELDKPVLQNATKRKMVDNGQLKDFDEFESYLKDKKKSNAA